MEGIFLQIEGKWQCDFEALAKKTNKQFAALEIEKLFKQHKDHIKVVIADEGEEYVNIVIYTVGLCYELVFNKSNQKTIVNWVSSSVVERMHKVILKQAAHNKEFTF